MKFQRKPRKRIRKFILELAADSNQEFGKKINEFITEMRAKSTEPHQKMLNEVLLIVFGHANYVTLLVYSQVVVILRTLEIEDQKCILL